MERPAAACSARSAASEIRSRCPRSRSSPRVDPELLQVADDHARVLAGDVAEDHVALGLVGGPRQVDQVARRRGRLEQVERVLGVVARRDDPQWTMAPPSATASPNGSSSLTACSPTITCTCAPMTSARRDEHFTDENVERYLAAAERARDRRARRLRARLPLHPGAGLLAPPLLGEPGARRPRRLLRVRPHDPLKLGIEADYVRGAEDRIANLLEARDFDYVVGSVHFLGEDGAVDDSRYDVWETISDPDELWRTYFEWIAEVARSGLFDILAHPDLVKLWGTPAPRPRATRAPTTSPRSRPSPKRDRGRGLHRRPAQARGRDLPAPALPRCASRPGRVRALLRRPRARPGRLRLRAGARVPRRPRGRADLRLRGPRAAPRAAAAAAVATVEAEAGRWPHASASATTPIAWWRASR